MASSRFSWALSLGIGIRRISAIAFAGIIDWPAAGLVSAADFGTVGALFGSACLVQAAMPRSRKIANRFIAQSFSSSAEPAWSAVAADVRWMSVGAPIAGQPQLADESAVSRRLSRRGEVRLEQHV